MRKTLTCLLAGVLSAGLLAACEGNGQSGTPDSTAGTNNAAQGGATTDTPAGPDLGGYPNPEETICLPDGLKPSAGRWGRGYRCAATAYRDGHTVPVAFYTTTPLTDEPANHWFNLLNNKPLDDEQLAAFGLADGDDSINPPKGPVCLYDGAICCVGPDYPDGFAYYRSMGEGDWTLGAGNLYYQARGLPDTLPFDDISDLLQDYTVYTLYRAAQESEVNPFRN
ncbi:MAG: hypothetical protein LBR19_03660 [Bifidobacteriaceae bacterium]|jgi:hypothetical protein|nr:hypothetical protein [Bifidobacteriaceae bacterium]